MMLDETKSDGESADAALLSNSKFLTRHEVLRRRSDRAKWLAGIYRSHYWALMEDSVILSRMMSLKREMRERLGFFKEEMDSMSAADLAGLCENLLLADEDGAVLEIAEEAQMDGEKDVNRCLVGRVLSGKKINMEAFKNLIDQLWNPFGNVEVELVSENTFMFYFVNQDERNRFWNRGPWHFGKNLIVLKKPVGFGAVSKLEFNKTEFWIQIHDIPIMCMNRRTARWLAEQIGVVIEILAESRECWDNGYGTEIRKTFRLLDFYFTCGKVGHVLKECNDEEAKQFRGQISGSSLERDKSQDKDFDLSGERSNNIRSGSLVSQNGDSASAALVVKEVAKEMRSETLNPDDGPGLSHMEKMIIDGPSFGPVASPTIMDCLLEEAGMGLLKDSTAECSKKPNVGMGDRNSKYFHAKASTRKKKNHLSSLRDSAGRSHVTEQGMSGVVSSFFSFLFKSSNPSI
ncbi:hypothetical protein EZV62_002138 [Acer yangbiense]|uniref:DUF4283 domain-containing protein n=1 Tax=Acer yangbiense TaxID=1000413 RepID=A0A5C7IWU4_9ROSI|nr:hypothetical protein EZV62_002138 [Acer yangbiense]